MPADAVSETVQLLESLARRAAEVAAVFASLDLDALDLAALAGEVQRVNARLADAEERLAFAGPALIDQRSPGVSPRLSGWIEGSSAAVSLLGRNFARASRSASGVRGV
jgi:hypothetical protein